MIKRCLYNSELQTKALQTEAIQFPFPPQTHSPSLSTLLFVQGGQLVEIPCYLASTCVQVMESPRREESEVRLFSPFLLSAGFPQASCVIPPKITLILRSLFPQRSHSQFWAAFPLPFLAEACCQPRQCQPLEYCLLSCGFPTSALTFVHSPSVKHFLNCPYWSESQGS